MENLSEKPSKHDFAKALRKNMTPQEKLLWEAVRNRKIAGLKFRRQVAIGNYIVDFLCVKEKLIIEVDGGIHHEQKEYDAMRQELLEMDHYQFLRFTNEEIDFDLEKVIRKIIQYKNPLSSGQRNENQEKPQ
jgi:very-short-patch-repair endonuclease